MAKRVLSCSIRVNDSFTRNINKFVIAIQQADNAFKTFSRNLDTYSSRIGTNINNINTKLGAMQQKTNSIANSISTVSIKQANTMKTNQERAISDVEKRYQQMQRNITKILNDINKESNRNIERIGGISRNSENNNNSNSESSKNYNMLGSLLSGNFTSVLGKLGLIGSAITGSIAIAKSINNALDNGFDILNKASGNMFSYDGIKDAMNDAMEYQTGRQSLDLFYGSKQKGLEEYQVATKVARETYASESDTLNIVSKLGMMGINVSEKQLRNLIDVAGTRSTVSTDHIGLAVQEALENKPNMLNMYSINKTRLQQYLKEIKKSDPSEYKNLKGAFNKKGGVGDMEKYWLLLNSYIEQSPMRNYAKTFEQQTLAGKLKRIDGIIKNVKSEILGMDIDTGEVKKGGAFEAFGNAVDKLKNKLEDPKTQALLEKIGEGFANVIGSISDSVIYLIDNVDWEEFAESIKEVGKSIADIINKLAKSGFLEQLAEYIPTGAKKVINNEAIKTEGSVTSQTLLNEGHPIQAFGNYLNTKWKQLINSISPEAYEFQVNEKPMSDSDLYVKIDTAENKDMSISREQAKELKKTIKDDGVDYYNIHIDTINANNFDEIMDSLKKAQNNRK